ncbi:MAG TPA: hypothetical protein DCY20_06460 [Firmicutes bacterium]|nr:hypothetical protein [Bacillota bacterium]
MIPYNEEYFNEPFVNDELVIGKWKVVGFHGYDQKGQEIDTKAFSDYRHQDIYFLPKGEGYWIFEGWTKGKLCTWAGGDEPYLLHEYELMKRDQMNYMFLTTKESDMTFVNILVQVSNLHFSVDDFAIREEVDYPFIADEDVLGEWESVGFVDKIEQFDVSDLRSDLWMYKIVFEEAGNVTRYYRGESPWCDKWTKGKLIDLKKQLVSRYEIQTIDHETYLFMEWKMGNYTYGHFPPKHYVLKKVNVGTFD